MKRYTQRSFPPYRYVPAVHPHPEIHPEGHSYNTPEEKAPRVKPEKWQQNELYQYGVDLFNHGYWWEAHEAWERVWLTTKKFDLEGQFLQALIQFSAALLKLYSGSLAGFTKLYGEAKKRMDFCLQELPQNQEVYMGLQLLPWLEQFKIFQQHAPDCVKNQQDPLKSEQFPFLVLKP